MSSPIITLATVMIVHLTGGMGRWSEAAAMPFSPTETGRLKDAHSPSTTATTMIGRGSHTELFSLRLLAPLNTTLFVESQMLYGALPRSSMVAPPPVLRLCPG